MEKEKTLEDIVKRNPKADLKVIADALSIDAKVPSSEKRYRQPMPYTPRPLRSETAEEKTHYVRRRN